MTIDIGSRNGYPSSSLSNFAPHPFVFRGFKVSSMEGLLQGLKFKNPEIQKSVFLLIGKKAKFKGKRKNWYREQLLYFQGKPIKRDSYEYQQLLNEAFTELCKNTKFRKALLSTGNSVLTHSIGKTSIKKTVLTRQEFCSILMKMRYELSESNEKVTKDGN